MLIWVARLIWSSTKVRVAPVSFFSVRPPEEGRKKTDVFDDQLWTPLDDWVSCWWA